MPLDPSIPLSVRPPQGLNIAAAMRETASLKQLGLQSDNLALQSQNLALENTARRDELEGREKEKAIIPMALVKDANGIDTYDRERIKKEFIAAGIADRLPKLLASLDDWDKTALELQQAKASIAQRGLMQALVTVEAAGSTPGALKLAAAKGVANGFFSKPEADQILEYVGDDPAKAREVVMKLQGKKPALRNVNPGVAVVDDNNLSAGAVFTAPALPDATQTKEINVDGKYFGSAIFDPKARQYLDPQTLKPITGKITEHYNPPASIQINAAANASWTDDQIDFYARQIKDDASKMPLVSGLPPQVRSRIEKRIADIGGNINKLSQASRTMREMATEVLPHIDAIQAEAEQLNKLGLLGPIAGRWREFLAGKVGAGELAGGNPKTAQLIGKFRVDAGLMTTAVMKAHTGARGSSQLLDHFSDLLGADKADISTFTGELNGFKDWMKGYAQMGSDSNAPAGGGADPYEEYLKRQGASGR